MKLLYISHSILPTISKFFDDYSVEENYSEINFLNTYNYIDIFTNKKYIEADVVFISSILSTESNWTPYTGDEFKLLSEIVYPKKIVYVLEKSFLYINSVLDFSSRDEYVNHNLKPLLDEAVQLLIK